MLDKLIFHFFIMFWSFMALILIVTDILSYYNLIRNDGFQLINRHYNCPLAYVLIVPCLLYSLITSLLKLIK